MKHGELCLSSWREVFDLKIGRLQDVICTESFAFLSSVQYIAAETVN